MILLSLYRQEINMCALVYSQAKNTRACIKFITLGLKFTTINHPLMAFKITTMLFSMLHCIEYSSIPVPYGCEIFKTFRI